MTHPTTLDALHGFFNSQLFWRDNVGLWRDAGSPTIEQKALAAAREAVSSYAHTPEPSLRQELDATFAKACAALGVDVASQPIPRPE